MNPGYVVALQEQVGEVNKCIHAVDAGKAVAVHAHNVTKTQWGREEGTYRYTTCARRQCSRAWGGGGRQREEAAWAVECKCGGKGILVMCCIGGMG